MELPQVWQEMLIAKSKPGVHKVSHLLIPFKQLICA
jgi:hypothetical protein